jgi:nucleotide-binding universal stress UspA family protein
MSKHMLHLRSPLRMDEVAAIVGDRAALEALQRAVDTALATGSGGGFFYSSDGEGYALAIALEDEMDNVHTTYQNEPAPVRSLRERVPMYAVRNYSVALHKAMMLRETGAARPMLQPSAAHAAAHGVHDEP